MCVTCCSTSASVLSCSGDRCRITTKAMPESGGIARKNACSAGMLPAEPPRPTIGSWAVARGSTTSCGVAPRSRAARVASAGPRSTWCPAADSSCRAAALPARDLTPVTAYHALRGVADQHTLAARCRTHACVGVRGLSDDPADASAVPGALSRSVRRARRGGPWSRSRGASVVTRQPPTMAGPPKTQASVMPKSRNRRRHVLTGQTSRGAPARRPRGRGGPRARPARRPAPAALPDVLRSCP